jgi:hypothetical protein
LPFSSKISGSRPNKKLRILTLSSVLRYLWQRRGRLGTQNCDSAGKGPPIMAPAGGKPPVPAGQPRTKAGRRARHRLPRAARLGCGHGSGQNR